MPSAPPQILAFATQGANGNDEDRIRTLLRNVPAKFFPFDHSRKRSSFQALRQALHTADLAIMEGTGIAGGMALIASGKPYIVSSGDAIAPFVAAKRPALAPIFARYERSLYARSRGFIGWTPYLTGRALTLGAPRAMTAAGWNPFATPGTSLRQQLGIPPAALVIGIAGSLDWNPRVSYCYGQELVQALRKVQRTDVYALIVGGGSGLSRLAGPRVILPGVVPRHQIPNYLATMDLASLPQSCDQLGSFRYSTKLPEYLAAGLPIVTGQLPLAYDLDSGFLWRLPGQAPWDATYTNALAALLDSLTPDALARRRAAVPQNLPLFDRESQIERATSFVHDILTAL